MKEITLKAVIESIPQATSFVDEQLEAIECPMKAQMQLDVAIDELFCNIASYAYGAVEGKATVRFDYDPAARRVILSFIDEGVPFNPLESDEPDVSLSAEERAIGGLGIFLVKKTMDSIKYRYENGQNILTIEKQI